MREGGNPVGLGYHRKMDAPPGFPLSREWRNHGPALNWTALGL